MLSSLEVGGAASHFASAHASDPTVAAAVLAFTIFVMSMAVLFNFTNGFHDAGNSTAIVVATKSLAPIPAVVLAAVFNLLPLFFASDAVADTVAKSVNAASYQGHYTSDGIPYGLFLTWSALISAIFWNYFTWHLALPSSSSHALIGGLVGAGLAAGGLQAVNWQVMRDILISIVASPALAFAAACLVVAAIRLLLNALRRRWPLPRSGRSDTDRDDDDVDPVKQSPLGDGYDDHAVFRALLLLFSILLSYGHGSNDAQKSFGLMAASLASGGYLQPDNTTLVAGNGTSTTAVAASLPIPMWVKLLGYLAITLGTLFGGWSIIKTLGMSITRLTKASGVAANVGAVVAVNGATYVGIPISTTHAITSAIVGSGVGQCQPVTWSVVARMLAAWLTTLPCVTAIGYVVMAVSIADTRWLAYTFDCLVVVGLLAYALLLSLRARHAYKEIEVSLANDDGATTALLDREELADDDDDDNPPSDHNVEHED